jgi:hypothetical protein
MTARIDAGRFATRDAGNGSASVVEMVGNARAHRLPAKAGAARRPLVPMFRAVAGVLAGCWRRMLAGLHESRRRQAAMEWARYRHLINGSATGSSFAVSLGEEGRRAQRRRSCGDLAQSHAQRF